MSVFRASLRNLVFVFVLFLVTAAPDCQSLIQGQNTDSSGSGSSSSSSSSSCTNTVAVSQTTGAGSVATASNTTGQKIAQSFQVPATGTLVQVDIKQRPCTAITSSTGTLIIYSGGATPEAGTSMATSSISVTNSSAPNTLAWWTYSYSNSITLTAGTTYYFVLSTTDGAGSTGICTEDDGGANSYANGTDWTYTAGSWTNNTTRDFVFKITTCN